MSPFGYTPPFKAFAADGCFLGASRPARQCQLLLVPVLSVLRRITNLRPGERQMFVGCLRKWGRLGVIQRGSLYGEHEGHGQATPAFRFR
jgi:hypothetical protein